MSIDTKSVLVVLGMHRSGTSAVTRGLQVFGVDLGNRLMPPSPNINEKGFYEDVDIVQINNEVLKSFEQDWHTLTFVSGSELVDDRIAHLRMKAIELIRSKLSNTDCFGMKDPRLCRLLPFWKRIFKHLQIKASYIIVVRNPISVSKSLDKIHHLPPEKCHYLWLEHILPSMLLTKGSPRVVVDYDNLMNSPEDQIYRIAKALRMESRLDHAQLVEFAQDFLDRGLRHAAFQAEDVFEDPLVPNPVKKATAILVDIASDRLNVDSKKVHTLFHKISEQMDGFAQGLSYLHRLDNIIASLNHSLLQKTQNIESLNKNIVLYEHQINELTNQNQLLKNQAATLSDSLAKHHSQINELTNQNQLLKNQAATLSDSLAKHHSHIGGLTKNNKEQHDHIKFLENTILEKDKNLQQFNVSLVQATYRLKNMRNSIEWKSFRPIRSVKNLGASVSGKMKIVLIPLQQLERDENNWRSTGNDPQFLMIAKRTWHSLTGWYWLCFQIISTQPLNMEVYFDTGSGFHSSQVVSFKFSEDAIHRVPFFVPSGCRAIRFDPCDLPTIFKISEIFLEKTKSVPFLTEDFVEQSVVYEAMGGRGGNAGTVTPVKGVNRSKNVKYCWQSFESDPWFELKQVGSKLKPGWYMIETRIRTDIGASNATLYFDYGKGYNQSDSVTFPFFSRRRTKRLHLVKAKPIQMRFDPLESPGNFSIEHLRFVKLNSMSVPYRMLRRVRSRYSHYRKLSIFQAWFQIKKESASKGFHTIEWLNHCYDGTFSPIITSNEISYSEWIARCESPEFSNKSLIEKTKKSFKTRPTISVVLPVFNPSEDFLKAAVQSVMDQSYENWELCIADDASPNNRVQEILQEYSSKDSRIKTIFRDNNGHISAASNSALTLAKGEYVAFLDHDDTLAPHALFYVVESINMAPSAKIIYSDEDKIDATGVRSSPHFKPDWNPDLFLSQNYICHLSVIKRELLNKIEGLRLGVEGSQDYDLLLRCLPYVEPNEILHIPKVLYHWRMLEGSTALGSSEKSYTTEAGIKALQDHFNNQGKKDIKVEPGLVPNTYRVRYPIPKKEPLVSLLIPTKDKVDLLDSCLKSIFQKTNYKNYEIVIIDNQSSDDITKEYLDKIQNQNNRVKLYSYPYSFNFSAINNYGVNKANGELIGLINNDIEVISPEWLSEMVSHVLRPEIGCVGAKLYYPDETIQHAGVIIGLGGVAGHSHKYFPRSASGYFHRLKIVQNLSAVTAACLLVRKEVYTKIGGFEENHLKIAFNDVDFCLRLLAAGYRIIWTPYAEMYHHESKSRGLEDSPDKIKRFKSEVDYMKNIWGHFLKRDPYYSPNLTLAREDFSL